VWPPDGFEGVEPLGFAVPDLGQMECSGGPAMAGRPGGDGDQLTARGDSPGSGVAAVGKSGGSAPHRVWDGGDGQSGGVGVELPAGRASGHVVRSARAARSRRAAVPPLGLDQQWVWVKPTACQPEASRSTSR